MKIEYRLTQEIDKPIELVTRLFTDKSLLKEWQPGLLDVEFLESRPYLKHRLTYQIGRRKMKMIETILDPNLPGHFVAEYVLKGAKNHIVNTFEKIDESRTRWTADHVHTFKGLMMLVAWFMKNNFSAQSAILMRNLKGYAESRK